MRCLKNPAPPLLFPLSAFLLPLPHLLIYFPLIGAKLWIILMEKQYSIQLICFARTNFCLLVPPKWHHQQLSMTLPFTIKNLHGQSGKIAHLGRVPHFVIHAINFQSYPHCGKLRCCGTCIPPLPTPKKGLSCNLWILQCALTKTGKRKTIGKQVNCVDFFPPNSLLCIKVKKTPSCSLIHLGCFKYLLEPGRVEITGYYFNFTRVNTKTSRLSDSSKVIQLKSALCYYSVIYSLSLKNKKKCHKSS